MTILPDYQEAELALVASLFDSPGVTGVATAGFPLADMRSPIARAVFAAYRDDGVADDVVLATRASDNLAVGVQDVMAYIERARQVPHQSDHVETYVELIKQAALERRVLAILNDAIEGVMHTGRTSDVIVETMALLKDSLPNSDMARDIAEVVDSEYETVAEYHNDPLSIGQVRGLNTGLRKLNTMTGGLKPSLVIVAARPSVGKTALAAQLAVNVANDMERQGVPKTVLYFTNEMTDSQLLRRMACAQAEVNTRDLEQGRLGHEDLGRYFTVLDRLRTLPLEVAYSRQIDAILARGYQRPEPGLIIVDYLNKMAGGHGENRNQQLGSIASMLFDLAYDVQVPVLLLAQLSRNVKHRGQDASPQMEDLRDSGELEQIADIILMLDRASDPDSETFDPRALKVYKRKDRLGGDQNAMSILYFGSYGQIKDAQGG
jgi:replicative DNA helicase